MAGTIESLGGEHFVSVPLTKGRHFNKRWIRSLDYRFAKTMAFPRLAIAEFDRACSEFPIVFARVAEQSAFYPVAVLGLRPLENAFVSSGGIWSAGYVPASFRGFPFSLSRQAGDRFSLCVNEAAGSVVDSAAAPANALPFFNDTGETASEVSRILSFLVGVEKSLASAQALCGLLEKFDLLVPIEPAKPVRAGMPLPEDFSRFFIVDEKALAAMSDENLIRLRRGGFLGAIYSHLVSLHQFSKVANQLMQVTKQSRTPELAGTPSTGFERSRKSKTETAMSQQGNASRNSLPEIDFSALLD
jgi:hypothetical protein